MSAGGRARTRVYLVCSPLGSVGKTLTARLLLDHALSTATKARGFDTNHLDPDLERLFPIETTVVDLSSIRGQMAFFDRLVVPDGAPKVVDLWHAAYDQFWAQAKSLGFFAEAAAQGVETIVFLQADRKDRFLHEAGTLPSRIPHLTLVLVHNQGLMKNPSSEAARLAIMQAKQLLIVPEFDAAGWRLLDRPGALANAVHRAPVKVEPHAVESREILKRVFDQLKFMELTLAKAR